MVDSREDGGSAYMLSEWVKTAEVDSGKRAGVPTQMAEEFKALDRENRELHPEARTALNWKIPIIKGGPGYGAGDADNQVFGGADRLRAQAG